MANAGGGSYGRNPYGVDGACMAGMVRERRGAGGVCLFVRDVRAGRPLFRAGGRGRIDPDDCAAAGFVLAAGPDCLRGGGFHRCGTVAVPALLRMEPGAIRLLCRAFSVAALYSPAEQERAGHARINM